MILSLHGWLGSHEILFLDEMRVDFKFVKQTKAREEPVFSWAVETMLWIFFFVFYTFASDKVKSSKANITSCLL
jgi:hypothetical protein